MNREESDPYFSIKLIFLPTWKCISCLSKWQQSGQLSVTWPSTKVYTVLTRKAGNRQHRTGIGVFSCTRGLELRGVLLTRSVSSHPSNADSKPAAERLWGRRLGNSQFQYSEEYFFCQDNMFCLFTKEYIWSKISGLICLDIFVIDYTMSVFSRSLTYYAYIWACQRNVFTNVCLMWMHLNYYSNNEYFLLLNMMTQLCLKINISFFLYYP